jgi:hypothetical protein
MVRTDIDFDISMLRFGGIICHLFRYNYIFIECEFYLVKLLLTTVDPPLENTCELFFISVCYI